MIYRADVEVAERVRCWTRVKRVSESNQKFEPAPELQALVYDTFPSAWRKVPESDARSVAGIPIPAPPLFQSKWFE